MKPRQKRFRRGFTNINLDLGIIPLSLVIEQEADINAGAVPAVGRVLPKRSAS